MSAAKITIPETREIPLHELHPAPWNPRLIKDRRFKQLCDSLTADSAFLWERPILATLDGTIYAGNMRYRAAEHLGWSSIPARLVDIPEQLAKERALRDNNQFGEWQEDDLAALLYDLQQHDSALDLLGFDDKELQRLLDSVGGLGTSTDPEPQLDRAAGLQAQWGTERGQLWEIPSLTVLGKAHRLLCGDSTSAADVARLMNGERAQLFVTDPPYGIDYDSAQLHRNETHYDAIAQDDLKDQRYQAWLESVFGCWVPHLREDAAWYLWHPMLTQGYFAAAAAAAAVLISRQIIWIKPQFIFGRGEYHWQHELCFYGWRQGGRPPFYGERNQTTVWSIGYDGQRNDRDHPTQKPAELFRIPMRNHTKTGEWCAEPFSGSGTQFVAGENTGRLVAGMEIEPKYVAVALQRLADMGLDPRCTDG